MKKVLVLLSAVLLSGCFICHKNASQEDYTEQGIAEQQSPAQEEQVIVRYSFPEIANFAFNSTEAEPDLNKMGLLAADIAAYPDATVLVEGYTDNIGPEEYNKKLSVQRAKVVAEQLAEQGVTNPIRIFGAGSQYPIASNDTPEGRAQNRRVDVVLIQAE